MDAMHTRALQILPYQGISPYIPIPLARRCQSLIIHIVILHHTTHTLRVNQIAVNKYAAVWRVSLKSIVLVSDSFYSQPLSFYVSINHMKVMN